MVLTLYKMDASPPVRAVYMILEVLGINDVEMVDLDLFAEEHLKDDFRKINPQHTVPTLKDDDVILWDSHAICAYLVNKYAENNPLYPQDPKTRAPIDQRLYFDSGILFPALRDAAKPVLMGAQKEFKPEHLERLQNGYEFLEKFLTSTWLVGEQLTLADICCMATVSTMSLILPIDGDLYPNLTAWLGRCASKEFYTKANARGLELFRHLLMSKLA